MRLKARYVPRSFFNTMLCKDLDDESVNLTSCRGISDSVIQSGTVNRVDCNAEPSAAQAIGRYALQASAIVRLTGTIS
jgi:hypothetical protein